MRPDGRGDAAGARFHMVVGYRDDQTLGIALDDDGNNCQLEALEGSRNPLADQSGPVDRVRTASPEAGNKPWGFNAV